MCVDQFKGQGSEGRRHIVTARIAITCGMLPILEDIYQIGELLWMFLAAWDWRVQRQLPLVHSTFKWRRLNLSLLFPVPLGLRLENYCYVVSSNCAFDFKWIQLISSGILSPFSIWLTSISCHLMVSRDSWVYQIWGRWFVHIRRATSIFCVLTQTYIRTLTSTPSKFHYREELDPWQPQIRT